MRVVCIKERTGVWMDSSSLYAVEERVPVGSQGEAHECGGGQWSVDWDAASWSEFDTREDMMQCVRPVGVSSDTPKKDDKR